MANLNKYIGIPHYYGQSTFDQCDCAGLAKLFYATEGFKEPLDDHRPIGTQESYKGTPLRMLRYLLANLDKIKDHESLQWGDIVVFRISGELHVGIYTRYGKVLSMQVPVVYGKSKSTIYPKQFWNPLFICGFRSRKEDVNGNISTPVHL